MWWAMCGALAWAAPGSPGVWTSAESVLGDTEVAAAGSAEGWLVLGRSGGALSGWRVAPSGVAIDSSPLTLMDSPGANPIALWDGVGFQVIGETAVDYKLPVATLGAVEVDPVGGAATAVRTVAAGLGWPEMFAGACDASRECTVVLRDGLFSSPEGAWRFAFDPVGSSAPLGLDEGVALEPSDAAWDGDRLVFAARVDGGVRVGWLPPLVDADDPTEWLVLAPGANGVPKLALAADGVALVAWADASTGEILAQRVHRVDGLLDAAPLALGVGVPGSSVDVAFTGTSFAVATDDHDAGTRVVVRVDADGAVVDTTAFAADQASYPHLVAGAPGHLLWLWFDGAEARFVTVEADVPDGGACHDDIACLSGSCDAGVCVAEGGVDTEDTEDTGDTGESPDTEDADDTSPAGVETGVADSAGSTKACGCGSSGGGAVAVPLVLLALARRRRR